MFERVCIVVLALLISGLSVTSVAGHGPFAGPVLIVLSYNHGIDRGDVPVALGWALGMACLFALWRRTDPSGDR